MVDVSGSLFRLVRRAGRYIFLVAAGLLSGIVLFVLQGRDIGPLDPADPGEVASVAWDALRLGAAAGLLALALVQVLKNLTSLRGWFHKHELDWYIGAGDPHAWFQLEEALGTAAVTIGSKDSPSTSLFKERDLRYYFDLPLEQLMGQISAAVELALANPDRFEILLYSLSGSAREDLPTLLQKTGTRAIDDEGVFDARSRVALAIQRNIDSMHIIVGHRWRWFVRSLTLAISLGASMIASLYTQAGAPERVTLILVATCFGAFSSWAARDAIAAVERVRR